MTVQTNVDDPAAETVDDSATAIAKTSNASTAEALATSKGTVPGGLTATAVTGEVAAEVDQTVTPVEAETDTKTWAGEAWAVPMVMSADPDGTEVIVLGTKDPTLAGRTQMTAEAAMGRAGERSPWARMTAIETEADLI